jgi:hypothetical protein
MGVTRQMLSRSVINKLICLNTSHQAVKVDEKIITLVGDLITHDADTTIQVAHWHGRDVCLSHIMTDGYH